MDYQDIITFEEEAVMLLEDKEAWALIEDPRYEAIIIVLRKGPMTVKDLETAYNLHVAKKIDKMPLETKEKNELKEKTKRKGKTLYKYLDVLEKKGLIKQVGKRVKMGQTASETIYGRSAKLYLMCDKHKIELKKDEVSRIMPVLGKIVSLEKKEPKVSVECFTKFMGKVYSLLQNERQRVFNEFSEEIREISSNIHYDELNLVVHGLDFYFLITHAAELRKELEKCFKS
ncbi:MAG: hypothetical protein KGD59_03765 [Candidatus Heimdallarchaeota archaeon]|nr:hypothetical protein [Candidatus Heimdallarchaeota archaeon]MBY8993642.1 hypothetical protein [Candidatus Heimdallarchaeota archaeon]